MALRLGIATDASFSLAGLEATESADLHRVLGLQSMNYAVEYDTYDVV